MIGFVIGFFLGLLPTAWFINENRKRKKRESSIPKYTRRGILQREYSVKRLGTKLYDAEVQFEIGELESTDKLSKVEVISCICNQSGSNDDKSRKEFIDLVNNSWIRSSEVNWITTLASKRNNKIDEILN